MIMRIVGCLGFIFHLLMETGKPENVARSFDGSLIPQLFTHLAHPEGPFLRDHHQYIKGPDS